MNRKETAPTWILTADGHHARAWEWKTADVSLALVADLISSADSASSFSRDLKSDKPGRSFASVDARRSAMEPAHDPHDFEKTRFAAKLADTLGAALHQGRFCHLIVIAPPRMLGDLRQHFPKPLQDAVIGEVDKDLMKSDAPALLYHAKPFLSAA